MASKRDIVANVGINDCQNIKGNPHYIKWHSMISRCYNPPSIKTEITYFGISVCNEWLTYSNFEKWSLDNFHKGLHLDKDILVTGNKIYSPETCCYVPKDVNNILVLRCNARGDYPLGVSKMAKDKRSINERKKPYLAKITDKGKTVNMGYFEKPLDAHKMWQLAKSKQIQRVVSWYATQECFSTVVADALISRSWNLLLDHAKGVETKNL